MAKMTINRRTVVMVLIVVLFVLVAILWVTYSSVDLQQLHNHSLLGSSGGSMLDASNSLNRLSKYCNIGPLIRMAESHGKLEDTWELQYMAINIRHGDRSSIHKLPGTATERPRLLLHIPKHLDNRTMQYVEKLKSFSLSPLAGKDNKCNFEQNEEKDLKSAMNPKKILQRSDANLPPGQLTSVGFMQHIELGSLLHSIYGGRFLSKVPSTHMYVRSTNYARTVQSVSALLIAMMPHLANDRRRVKIHYYPNEADEIMHGLGVRSTSHATATMKSKGKGSSAGAGAGSSGSGGSGGKLPQQEEDNAEQTSSGGCDASVRMAAQQDKAFTMDVSLRSELVNRLGEQLSTRPVGHMADALLPNYCHAQPLPCSIVEDKVKAGTSGLSAFLRATHSAAVGTGLAGARGSHCLNYNDLAMIMSEADRQYCERFAGTQGGLNSTKLSIFPFLREITEHVVTAALQGADRKEQLSVFSGHDTVIAPVLAGLGVYSGELCVWPGYASNIVVELWQPKSTARAGTGKSTVVTSSSLKKLFPALWDAEKAKESRFGESFVRVLYNGDDVTQRIPACTAERGLFNSDGTTTSSAANAVSSSADKTLLMRVVADGLTLCSLDALVQQVGSLVDPHASIEEACSAK